MSFTRYAIYYLPPAGALADFGARWLGWDVRRGAAAVQLDLPGLRDATEAPRKYGFHGTLKPPFRLAEGQERLIDALESRKGDGEGGIDAESRMRLRSIDVQMLRILEEMSAGRQESMAELRKDIELLVKALARAFRWKRMLESGAFAQIGAVGSLRALRRTGAGI